MRKDSCAPDIDERNFALAVQNEKALYLTQTERVSTFSIPSALPAINKATVIKLRAERKAGELLAVIPGLGKVGGDRAGNATLPALGITKIQSSRWQHAAKVPEDAFREGTGLSG